MFRKPHRRRNKNSLPLVAVESLEPRELMTTLLTGGSYYNAARNFIDNQTADRLQEESKRLRSELNDTEQVDTSEGNGGDSNADILSPAGKPTDATSIPTVDPDRQFRETIVNRLSEKFAISDLLTNSSDETAIENNFNAKFVNDVLIVGMQEAGRFMGHQNAQRLLDMVMEQTGNQPIDPFSFYVVLIDKAGTGRFGQLMTELETGFFEETTSAQEKIELEKDAQAHANATGMTTYSDQSPLFTFFDELTKPEMAVQTGKAGSLALLNRLTFRSFDSLDAAEQKALKDMGLNANDRDLVGGIATGTSFVIYTVVPAGIAVRGGAVPIQVALRNGLTTRAWILRNGLTASGAGVGGNVFATGEALSEKSKYHQHLQERYEAGQGPSPIQAAQQHYDAGIGLLGGTAAPRVRTNSATGNKGPSSGSKPSTTGQSGEKNGNNEMLDLPTNNRTRRRRPTQVVTVPGTKDTSKQGVNSGSKQKGFLAPSQEQIKWWNNHPRFQQSVFDGAKSLIRRAAEKHGNYTARVVLEHLDQGKVTVVFDPTLPAMGRWSSAEPHVIRVNPFLESPKIGGRRTYLRTLDGIASTIVHEFTHSKGHGELRAWFEQFRFLHQVGRVDTHKFNRAKSMFESDAPFETKINWLQNEIRKVYGGRYDNEKLDAAVDWNNHTFKPLPKLDTTNSPSVQWPQQTIWKDGGSTGGQTKRPDVNVPGFMTGAGQSNRTLAPTIERAQGNTASKTIGDQASATTTDDAVISPAEWNSLDSFFVTFPNSPEQFIA